MPEETKTDDAAAKAAASAAAEKATADAAAAAKAGEDDPKAHIHKLNEENKKHRLRADALEKELGDVKGTLSKVAEVFGAKDLAPDKVKDIVSAKDGEMRSVILEAKVESAAVKAGLRDPADAARLLDLTDLTVDVAKRSVDGAALEKKLGELKKAKPYLFNEAAAKADGEEEQVEESASPNPGRINLGGKGDANPYQQWQQLLKRGDDRAAALFYRTKEQEIRKHDPASARK